MQVALVTCRNVPEPDPDAAPLSEALAAAGIVSEWVAWEDAGRGETGAEMTVLRSCWNYPQHREAFLDWAERTASASRLWNPLSVVRWSTHKRYLLELEQDGVPIVPTVLLPRGSTTRLTEILDENGWSEVVIKPAVSAASFKTRRFDPTELDVGQAHVRELLEDQDVLIQRYLSSVENYGERALVWIDGELTHAVRKTARFEGEDESVSAVAVEITPDEAALACRVLKAVKSSLLYARIDVAPGSDGKPVLMELELVEPSLFFLQCSSALDRFVSGIRRRLDRATAAC